MTGRDGEDVQVELVPESLACGVWRCEGVAWSHLAALMAFWFMVCSRQRSQCDIHVCDPVLLWESMSSVEYDALSTPVRSGFVGIVVTWDKQYCVDRPGMFAGARTFMNNTVIKHLASVHHEKTKEAPNCWKNAIMQAAVIVLVEGRSQAICNLAAVKPSRHKPFREEQNFSPHCVEQDRHPDSCCSRSASPSAVGPVSNTLPF